MKQFDIIIWGASSFTGKLVTEYIFNKYGSSKIKWAIAGRNLDKLEKVRSQVADEDIPIFIADSFDEDSLSKFVKKTKVVCSTVGPYSLYGTKLVKVCLENNTNYCDITGEAHWIRTLIDNFHEEAKSKKIKIVNSCGFDSIPSDMGVYFIQNEIKKVYKSYAKSIKMRVAGIRGGIRPGEKLHEVLINSEEIRNSWDLNNKFMISNPSKNNDDVVQNYDGNISKITDMNEYSSQYAIRHTKDELIDVISKSELVK